MCVIGKKQLKCSFRKAGFKMLIKNFYDNQYDEMNDEDYKKCELNTVEHQFSAPIIWQRAS